MITKKDTQVPATHPLLGRGLGGGFFLLLIALMTMALSAQAQRVTDVIDRGLVAVKTSGGVFVSWRIFGEEYYDTQYNLYRDGSKVNGTPLSLSNYTDKSGNVSSTYTVTAVVRGEEQAPCEGVKPWSQQYLQIPLGKVLSRTGKDITSEYTANDVSLGDLDGDGMIEFIIKRINQADADAGYPVSGSNYSVIEAYRLDGTRLWQLDCGPNMVSGSSVELNAVAFDWDEDGKAEVLLRGADNMILYFRDGDETKDMVIGSATVNSRGSVNHDDRNMAYTNTGNEYLLYLEGATGKPYAIGNDDSKPWMTYPLPRGNANDWGDGYGHRSSKYFFGAPFLDGRHASIFLARGAYTKHHMKAFDVDPVSHHLILRWEWRSDGLSREWFGQGYHNYSIADVDLDGRDEIVFGSMVIDDNGKGLSTTGLGHGDAQHCGDFDPYRPGLEFFACNESNPSCNYRDATTSELLYRLVGTEDDGRALCGNFTNDYPGAVASSSQSGLISCVASRPITGQSIDLPLNYRIYWDGDLLEETVNSPGIERDCIIEKRGKGRILQTSGISMCNWTKNTPCAQGDILGDWREELVLRTSDNKYLRVYTTTERTLYPISTLWHDHQYRQAMVWQSLGYNQPPHTSFFLGELEGITKEPPPLTLTGRTEVEADGTIGTDLDGRHVLLAATDDARFTLANGAQPYILTDNAPSWTQGANDNSRILTLPFHHQLLGNLSGATRLVKQGEGELILSSDAHTHTGPTDIWAGRVSFECGTGQIAHSNVWMNRFTSLIGEVQFGGNVTLEYGALLRPQNNTIDCICAGQMSMDTLSMHIGAGIQFRLIMNPGETPENDFVKAHRLVIQTKNWKYGPEYMAPVFHFHVDNPLGTGVEPGRYPIMEVDEVEGDLSDIILKGISGKKAQLVREGTTIYLVIEGVRDAASVTWSGAESAVWDYANTANFRNAVGGSDIFVTGDDVTFNDEATNYVVQLAGELPCDTVLVDASTAYTFGGTGALTGNTVLVKRGTGRLTITTDNTYTGGNHFEGGTVSVSSLANENQPRGGLGAVTTNANLFTLANGATLQTTAAVTCGSPIKMLGDEGGCISNNADFSMNKPFSGTRLTKKGGGWLKLYSNNASLTTLCIMAGTVESTVETPAKTVELQSGTINFDGNSSVAIHVPEGRSAAVNCYADRGTYGNKLTGAGTVTIYYPLVKGNDWYATRAAFNGNWSAFEGTVRVAGVAGDGRFCLNNAYGLPKGTLDIPSGMEVQSTGKTFRIGRVTGAGALGGGCSLSSAAAGTPTWQVGDDTDFTFDGTLRGSGTKFEKLGKGVMTITGQGSNATGTFSLSAGTLCLNNSKATKPMLGTGTVTAKSGTTLCGAGQVGGNVTVMSGATLRPGVKETSISGTLDFASKNVTVASGATLRFFISGASLYTKLTNIGTFTLLGDLVINLREEASGLAVGKEFTLWTAKTGKVEWSSIALPTLPEGLYWDITDLAAKGILRVTDDPALAVQSASLNATSVVRIDYVDLNGRVLTDLDAKASAPAGTLCIRRTHLSDGTIRCEKVMR